MNKTLLITALISFGLLIFILFYSFLFPFLRINSFHLSNSIDILANISSQREEHIRDIVANGRSFIDISDYSNKNTDLTELLPLIGMMYIGFDELGRNDLNTPADYSELLSRVGGKMKKQFDNKTPLVVRYDGAKFFAAIPSYTYEFSALNQLTSKEYIIASTTLASSTPGHSAIKVGTETLIENTGETFTLTSQELDTGIFDYLKLSPENILKDNTDFEKGVWLPENDCKEGEASLGVSISNDPEVDKKQNITITSQDSLRTCASKTFDVSLKSDRYYKLSFDYKNIEGEKVLFYFNLRRENSNESKNYQKFVSATVPSGKWGTYDYIIKAPFDGINKFDLFFYALPKKESGTINSYDNIILQEWVPSDIKSHYIVGTINHHLDDVGVEDDVVKYERVKPWEYNLILYKENGKYVLIGNGGFSKFWTLKVLNKNLKSSSYVILDNLHFKVNGHDNGWLIDVNAICENQDLCTKNRDGIYKISLVLGHTYNRYLALTIISGTTIFVCLGCLMYDFAHRRRKHKHHDLGGPTS